MKAIEDKAGERFLNQHYVSAKDESIRMFKNPILHFFSFVHWTTPLIIYVPLITYLLYYSYSIHELSSSVLVSFFILGIIAWTFFEYVAHRFIFHYHPSSEFGKRIHFILHGVHHDYPNDSWRLVMPPILSVPLATIFFFLFTYCLGLENGQPIYTGFIFGYLCYDMIHFATHHAKFIRYKWFIDLKKHHMNHHFTSPEEGYGVSSSFWDKIFNTGFKNLKK